MPIGRQGVAAPPNAAAAWSSGMSATAGSTYVRPSNGTPLVFLAQTNGPAGTIEPAWGAAPWPVPGSTYYDGGVTGICMGSYQMAGVAPIVFDPAGTDPPGAASVNVGLDTLADFMAAMQQFVPIAVARIKITNTAASFVSQRGFSGSPVIASGSLELTLAAPPTNVAILITPYIDGGETYAFIGAMGAPGVLTIGACSSLGAVPTGVSMPAVMAFSVAVFALS